MGNKSDGSNMLGYIFIREVDSAFQFVVDDYGFQCIQRQSTYITYESEDVSLNVLYIPRCEEMDIGIGLKNSKDNHRYGIRIVLQAMASDEDKIQKITPSRDEKSVRECVRKLSNLVKKYYGILLEGNRDAFKQLHEVEMALGEQGMQQYKRESTSRNP